MTTLTPDTPETLAALESSHQSHEEELPRAAWTDRDGYVWVHGIGHVPGGYRVERVPYREQVGTYTCQAPGCRELYWRPEVALWRRYESGLGRRMYWLGLAADAPQRSRCEKCGELSPLAMAGWNPRYLAYCTAHGQPDPDAMLAADEERYPGGKMGGFQLWLGSKWLEWRAANGRKADDVLSSEDHQRFDAWLAEGAP
jgi:hypothetical protein